MDGESEYVDSLRERIRTLEAACKAYKGVITPLQDTVEELDRRNKELETEVVRLKANYADAAEAVMVERIEVNRLKQREAEARKLLKEAETIACLHEYWRLAHRVDDWLQGGE
jgi:predicted RNase H-like nuclease (RuvC/YqgF family)